MLVFTTKASYEFRIWFSLNVKNVLKQLFCSIVETNNAEAYQDIQ